ncbi:uncharacterized protein LODBEIA_P16210 [Lodderomyces beijingensis]|uniref:Meiotic nuclear division protein 1 n=1 Tax=Lodderomyces beijingensis TaxID=1775926 RepID=A0ABP0ZMI1_9ASCO
MPPKRGQTQEEKLAALLKWFQSKHQFYTLKECEKEASKACKIAPMQIKDLVVNLVNEGVVQQEKCGTTNLYWSFKYSQHKQKMDQTARLKEEVVQKEQQKGNLEVQLAAAKLERSLDNFPQRQEELLRLKELEVKLASLNAKVEQCEELNKVGKLTQAIEFFNDSIEMLLSYLARTTAIDSYQLRKEFNIPPDLEDMDSFTC